MVCLKRLNFAVVAGSELRTQLNSLRVQIGSHVDVLKEMNVETAAEKVLQKATDDAKDLISKSKMLRAQAKAVSRELAPGCSLQIFCF